MKNILVPIDFSENAERALDAAKAIASKTGARLTILHAYQPYVPDISIPVNESSLPIYEEMENSYKSQFDGYVNAALKEGYDAIGVWVVAGIHSAILRQAKETDADLIVVGRTGKGGFVDKLIGSAATDIALDAKCPVLVIPPQVNAIAFRKVVYATQLEDEEMDILRNVKSLVKSLGASLSFVKISAPDQPNIQSDEQYIEEITKELGIPESDISIREGVNVLDGMEDYCDEVNADLLVVSTKARGFLERYIINPSITKKLVVDTHVPLLVYHMKKS